MFTVLPKQLSAYKITIHDETPNGSIIHQVKIRLSRDKITVKELIKERVFQEVADYNDKLPSHYFGIIQPESAQKVWFGYRIARRTKIDPHFQYRRTLHAFFTNKISILINEQELEDPYASIDLKHSIRISFMQNSDKA